MTKTTEWRTVKIPAKTHQKLQELRVKIMRQGWARGDAPTLGNVLDEAVRKLGEAL